MGEVPDWPRYTFGYLISGELKMPRTRPACDCQPSLWAFQTRERPYTVKACSWTQAMEYLHDAIETGKWKPVDEWNAVSGVEWNGAQVMRYPMTGVPCVNAAEQIEDIVRAGDPDA